MVLGLVALLILAAAASAWMDKHTNEMVIIIVAIAAIIGLVAFLKHRREVPKFVDKPIVPIDPEWEKLSGTFSCPTCGGNTTFIDEVNPSTACKYCGAELPDVKILILERNQRRQDLITEDLKRQQEDRQKRLDIHLENMNEYKLMKQEKRAENTRKLVRSVSQLVLSAIVGLGIVAITIFILFKWLHLV